MSTLRVWNNRSASSQEAVHDLSLTPLTTGTQLPW